MGQFLPKPLQEKESAHGEGNGLRYGLSSMQGWRVQMEDAHTAAVGLPGGRADWSFFAVYDGHAGAQVAKFCAANMLEHILPEGGGGGGSVEDVKDHIRSGFLKIDEHIRGLPEMRQSLDPLQGPFLQPGDATGPQPDPNPDGIDPEILAKYPQMGPQPDRSGCTAVGLLLGPDHLYFVNCGDSRALLCRDGGVAFSTTDHKPVDTREKERIKNAGGHIREGRVNGGLAVSRALGDYEYKCVEGKGPTEQPVSPEPEVCDWRRAAKGDEFVVLACDGIWDVMSNEELVEFVRSRLLLWSDLEKVCNVLLDTCLHKGSKDNMSVVLVCFPGAPKVSEEAVRKEYELDKHIKHRVKELLSVDDPPDLHNVEIALFKDNIPNLPPGGGIESKHSVIEAAYNKLIPPKEEEAAKEPPKESKEPPKESKEPPRESKEPPKESKEPPRENRKPDDPNPRDPTVQ